MRSRWISRFSGLSRFRRPADGPSDQVCSMTAVLVMLLIGLSGCAHLGPGQRPGWVKVSGDGTCFREVKSRASDPDRGTVFRPWGFNYDRDYRMRLIEDYWTSEWAAVVEDFQEMRALGANVVRVHLQFSQFMKDAQTPNAHALSQLQRLLKVAEKLGLHLDLTGLACYREMDVPAWYDAMDEQARWRAQAVFWRSIARVCRNSPAVFCYDLMNEPVVPASARKAGDWLVGQLAGYWYVQAITLDPGERDRARIARQWIDQLSGAIRLEDKHHLITVGMLPNSLETPVSGSGFPPSKVAGSLDFISVHVYPESKKLDSDLGNLRGFEIGKPLIVEEIFPLGCSITELGEFIDNATPPVDGWLGFYWGQTPAELATQKTLAGALMLNWLEFFQRKGEREGFCGRD